MILEKKMHMKTEKIMNILEKSNAIKMKVKEVNHLKIMILLEIFRKKNMKKVKKKVMIIAIEIKDI